MESINTFVVPIIVPDYIKRFLETLYEYTPPNFRVILIDQTKEGLPEDWDLWSFIKPKVHMYVRPYRNLGFAHAMNTGIRISDTKYVTCANDDVEFINKRWWFGVEEELSRDGIEAVNPMSVTEPGWGYGCNKNSSEELVTEKETALGCKFNREAERFEHLPYKKDYSEEEYDFLLNQKNGSIEGCITWLTTFKRQSLEFKGLFDERFFPGGGEDYDIGGRFYSEFWPSGEANPLYVCGLA
jgi:GT2 family glycosyltransferase